MKKISSKRAKACEFSQEERLEIMVRDNNKCIFCTMKYKMPEDNEYARVILSIMHYVPRSKGGLGIAKNGAIGCQYHHEMLDNGNQGNRKEMLDMFQKYLRCNYPDWDEEKLIYNKWEVMEWKQKM